jgi:hypothetical protein
VRTVVVSPVPGNSVASGNALWEAVNGITDASDTNPYLVEVEPGRYEFQGSGLRGAILMKDCRPMPSSETSP